MPDPVSVPSGVAKQKEVVTEKEAHVLGTGKFVCFALQFCLHVNLRIPSVEVIYTEKMPKASTEAFLTRYLTSYSRGMFVDDEWLRSRPAQPELSGNESLLLSVGNTKSAEICLEIEDIC